MKDESVKRKPKQRSGKVNEILEYTSNYVPADTFFHRLNPVTKIVWFVLMTILLLTQESLIIIFILTIYVFLSAAASELTFKHIIRKLRWILLFVVISVVINVLFNAIPSEQEQILFYIWDPYIPVRRLAVYFALRTSLWILALSTCGLIFMHSTAPQDIVYGIRKLGLGYKVAYSLMVGLRYIPLIQDQTRSVVIAQKARGLDRKNSTSLKRTLAMIRDRMVTSLILIFRNAGSTAMSMELRGFGRSENRTNTYSIKFSRRDYLFLIIMIILTAILIAYRFHLLSFIPPMPSIYGLIWA